MTHRKLIGSDVECLSPVQRILNLFVVLLKPLLHLRLRGDTHDIDNIHYLMLVFVPTTNYHKMYVL